VFRFRNHPGPRDQPASSLFRAPRPRGGDAFHHVDALIDMIAIGLIIPFWRRCRQRSPDRRWTRPLDGVVTFAFASRIFRLADPGAPSIATAAGGAVDRFCGFALNFFFTAPATSLWMLSRCGWWRAMQANMSVANATSPTSRRRRPAKRFGMMGRCSAWVSFSAVMAGCWARSTCGCRFSSPRHGDAQPAHG